MREEVGSSPSTWVYKSSRPQGGSVLCLVASTIDTHLFLFRISISCQCGRRVNEHGFYESNNSIKWGYTGRFCGSFLSLKKMIHFKMTQMNDLSFPNPRKKEKYIFLDAKYIVLLSATRTNLTTDSVI